MGSHTYGGISIELSRPLTAEEFDAYIAGLRAIPGYPEQGEGSQRDILGDDWDINGVTDGDIGRLTVDAEGLDIEVGGKVYEIAQALGVFLARLPADITCEGEGLFETEGEHWALRVKGREVKELQAELRIVEPDALPERTGMGSVVIRVDDEVYAAILAVKHEMEKARAATVSMGEAAHEAVRQALLKAEVD
jgi:hypothetical protein